MEVSHAHVDKVVTEFELSAVEKIVNEFRDLIHSTKVDINKAQSLFIQIKIALTKFQLIPPFTLEIPITKKQLSLARDALELGCFLSIEQKKIKAFEREFSKLKVFYHEYSHLLDESKQKQLLIGLHLCALLANNQIDEFHTELELITATNSPTATTASAVNNNSMQLEPLKLERKESLTDTLYSSAFIRYPVMLEQHLMEGSYNKIFAARAAMPSKYFSIFLDILSQTVRHKIAECSERAYPYYPLKDAAKLLLFDKESDVLTFAAERQWTIDQSAGRIVFNAEAKNTTLQTHQTIKQMFDYANELERII